MSISKDPCVHKCCINEEDICLGCFRTLDDILGWKNMTDTMKSLRKKEAQIRKKMATKENYWFAFSAGM